MPKFLDCTTDQKKHEEQVKALCSLMPKKWRPPDDVDKKKTDKPIKGETGGDE